jgi:hypothetical protein
MNVSTSVPRWRIRATVDVLKQNLVVRDAATHTMVIKVPTFTKCQEHNLPAATQRGTGDRRVDGSRAVDCAKMIAE